MGVLSGHTQDVKYVKWHPERDELYSASYDDTIKCWAYEDSLEDWVCKYTMSEHKSTVWCLDFDPTGNFLVSCSDDKSWIVWNISATGFSMVGKHENTHFRAIYSVSWCPGHA